jgi:uncharacterized membrane protein (UPF0127 family)
VKNAILYKPAVLLAVLLACAGCREGAAPALPPKTVADHFDIRVGQRVASLQIAVLPAELERGLMERRDLGPDEGMIFIFDSPQRLTFWMHDTPTPLDVGFFAPGGELEEIYPMLPYDERTVASRRNDLQYAVEMRQGWYAARGVRPGDRLDAAALAAALRERGFEPERFGLGR